MHYVLLYGDCPNTLSRTVNEHFSKGYKLFGHPFVAWDASFFTAFQAMIKEDKEKSNVPE